MMKNAPKTSYAVRKIAALIVLSLSFLIANSVAYASKRVALVIGNSAYVNATPLKNPRNDAEDISAKLEKLGFEVVVGLDLSSREMRDTVRKFRDKLREADVAMLYYAGHAMQVDGRNYLAPVNTDIRYKGDLDFETIPLDFIQRQMEGEAKTSLIFLDACRDNPLARNLRISARSGGGTRGLATETGTSEGTLIVFSTDPNNVALDGDGRNSPFTTALLENIERPGVEISTLMTDVRRQVYEATSKQQTPWINSSLLGRFYFQNADQKASEIKTAALDKKRTGERETKSTPTVSTSSSSSSNSGNSDQLLEMRVERLAWESVSESSDPDVLRAFIKSYGSGFFGDLAKLKLKRIESGVAAAKAKEIEIASLEKEKLARKIEVEKLRPEIEPRELRRQVQAELSRLGCSPGRPDGLWGKNSIRALGTFKRHANVQLASTQPDHDLLDQLKTFDKRICPAPAPVVVKKRQKKKTKTVRTQPRKKKTVRQQPRQQPRQQQVVRQQPRQQQVIRQQPQQQVIIQQPRQQQVIIQQPRQQQRVIVRQPQQVIVQQPQPQRRRSGLLGGAIGGAIGGVITCKITRTC